MKDSPISWFVTRSGVFHVDMKLPGGLLMFSVVLSLAVDWRDWRIGKFYVVSPLLDIEWHPDNL